MGGLSLSQHVGLFREKQDTQVACLLQEAYRQTDEFTLTFTPTDNSEILSPDLHIFGLWEETRGAAENKFRHTEGIQTPRLKPSETEIKQISSCEI